MDKAANQGLKSSDDQDNLVELVSLSYELLHKSCRNSPPDLVRNLYVYIYVISDPDIYIQGTTSEVEKNPYYRYIV